MLGQFVEPLRTATKPTFLLSHPGMDGKGKLRRTDDHDSFAARVIGRSRMIVIIAVVAVMLSAFSLFLLGAVIAIETIWNSWHQVIQGELSGTDATVRFLAIVAVMLKAVFFYLIGVGFYSLFISPLNLTVALGVETLNDLETKLISVVIVIMAVAFLERFIGWSDPVEVLQGAGALALAVAALVFFKIFTNREGQEARMRQDQDRARSEMFEHAHEEQDVSQEVRSGSDGRSRNS
jgi:uncharacterized membrane protein YqhA